MTDSLTITLDDGRTFPQYNGETLSWNPGSAFTTRDEQEGAPRTRAIIRAMLAHRPDQLERERRELNKAQLNKLFGHNARRLLAIIESEMA